MKDLYTALFNLVELLGSMSIPYAVMAGIAVRAYAIPRAMQDIDLTIGIVAGHQWARLPRRNMLICGNIQEPVVPVFWCSSTA